ncbi:MAG: hypothetical protein EXS32_01855 [Opitutus sp.]|nr:hypothetical protein [Opitutus sp.]
MMRRILVGLVLGLGGLVAASGAEATAAKPGERFAFVAFGCMPYGPENFPAYECLLTEINRHHPAFTVHCGDTKSGGEPPTEAFMRQVHRWFDSLEGALIYTPGDNEWTDVHRKNNGSQDPLVWLAKVRTEYFATERSMGRAAIPLVTQRREKGFEKFVENARWTHGGVVFATVHVVGSNNNRVKPDDRERSARDRESALAEFRERDAANGAWVRGTFAEARATQAPGVALFFQAEPFDAAEKEGGGSGFTAFLAAVEHEAKLFEQPVLLVHADDHRYRLEPKVKFPSGEKHDNVTRLGVFGARDIHAVLVTVDPGSKAVFLAGPLIVPENALPVLPRAKKEAGKK